MPRNSYLYLNISVENGSKTAEANGENVMANSKYKENYGKIIYSTSSSDFIVFREFILPKHNFVVG